MRKNRTSGTVPGAPGNRSPYGGAFSVENLNVGFFGY